jgi:hypothetical protein
MRFGRMIDVFNVEHDHVSIEDVSYLRTRDQQYGEFGGRIVFCSDQDYHCILGGIRVAVPKAANGQRRWSKDGIECERVSPFRGQQITATCAFADATTRFFYTRDNGIVWYERSGAPGRRFELVGSKGLFAAGAPSAEK